MTKLLFMDDSYLKEVETVVVDVLNDNVETEETVFHPLGGGLPADTGWIYFSGKVSSVVDVRKEQERVLHRVEGEVPTRGERVLLKLDWDRRYRIMRMHTAAHLLSALFYERAGALITGNEIRPERSRIDFSLKEFDRGLMVELVEEANRIIKEDRRVKIFYMEREEALSRPGLVKLAKALPPNLRVLRMVEIEGVDLQPDGGPHVSRLSEIGEIVLDKLENRGRENRRLYYGVRP